jgi:glycosyltransferase involved in cell wall biosynthesis
MHLSKIHILEIGDHYHFKQILFERTKLLWTGRRRPLIAPRDYMDCTPRAFAKAMRDVAAGKFDVVVAYAGQRSPWHPRLWLRAIFGSGPPFTAAVRVFGVTWLRYVRLHAPLIVLDMHDIPTIHSSNFFLLDLARIYFKRELPVDHWQGFYGTAHANLPTLRIRRDPLWQRRVAKLRPISLQAGLVDLHRPDADIFSAKTADVFFAGAVDGNSTVRDSGLRQLQKLASRGLRIDIATERLSQEDFYQRMSQAWLAWSPSGLGWDCYRHYEAPQCLAVPVINYPTIARHRPLEDGVHALYYAPEDDGLCRTIETALADKERLKRIAVAGRAHVRANHVAPTLCEQILRLTLEISSADQLASNLG